MGSPESVSERRKSVRQVRSTKKKIGSGGVTKEEENSAQAAGNESQIVKQEEVPQQITPKPFYGWQHPAELNYFTPNDWNDTKIIHHLIAYAFDVPPKSAKNNQPFCQIISMDGTKTVLPHGYRIPLMFLARFQWLSLKLVLSAANRQVEWMEYKFGILHVSRLCKQLLDSAQAALGAVDLDPNSGPKVKSKGVDRKWRCPTFDRALVRYRFKWFISKPAQVKEFWTEYGEEEYDKDVVALGWRSWALKGHRGFSLTEAEIQNGISAQELMQGLKEKDGEWYWENEVTPVIEGGTDAWALRRKALAAIPSFDTPNPLPVSCLPLSSTNSSNVASVPVPPPNKPLSTSSSIPFIHQNQSPSTASASRTVSSPASKSKSRTAQDDIMQIIKAAGVKFPAAVGQNGDITLSGTSKSAAWVASALNNSSSDIQVRNRSVGDKRPGSPLEKEGSIKRTLRSSLSHFVSASTVVDSEICDPEPPPFTPTIPYKPIKREPSPDPEIEILQSAPSRFKRRTSTRNLQAALEDISQGDIPTSPTSSAFSNITKDEAARLMRANENELKPMVLGLSSQRSDQSVGDDDDHDIAVDNNSPVERPIQPSSTLGNRPPPTVLPPRPTTGIPSMVRSPSTTSRPSIPLSNLVKVSPIGVNPPQQIPSPTSTHPSPPTTSNTKTLEYVRSLQTQWQQTHDNRSENSPAQSPVTNGIANTPGPSVQRAIPANQASNVRLMESLLPFMLEDTLRKFATEIKEAKDSINDVKEGVKDIVRSEMKNGLSDLIRGEMQKVRGGLESGDVKRELQNGLAGLGNQLEKGLQTYLTTQITGIMRSVTREEVGRAFEEAGTVRDLRKGGMSGTGDGVIDELRKELAKSREREKRLDAVLLELRDELKGVRETLSNRDPGRRIAPAVPAASTSNPVEVSLLLGHPLAHLCSETIDGDDTDSFDGRIPGLTYTEQETPPLQVDEEDGIAPPERDRSYSGTPMSMSPEIVLLELETAEHKYKIPDSGRPETPIVPPRPPPSPTLYEDIIDVKPVIIDGEAFVLNAAGEPTPVSAFPSPIPARSHRKFKKMGMVNGGES